MTDTSATYERLPLGVGTLISESFSILLGNFKTVIILGFVPMFVGAIISGLMMGWGVMLGTEVQAFSSPLEIALYVINMVIQMGIYGLMIALVVQMAYDAKLGRTPNISRYVAPAIRSVVPVLLVSIIVFVAIGIGFAALIVPGLWIYAVFSVIVPAIVIEQAGFGAMRRSSALTKDYRWPIVGLFFLIWICVIVISMIFGVVLVLAISPLGGSFIGGAIGILLISVINGFTYSLSAITVSLVYARLREIKEGVGVDQLAAVFE